MTIQFRKASAVKQLIGIILKSESLSYEERKFVKTAKSILEDATTGCEMKLQCSQETYQEMKQHKSSVENEDKAKAILKTFQDDRTSILSEQISLEITPIDFSFDFSKDGDKANDFKAVALELEDILFVYSNK